MIPFSDTYVTVFPFIGKRKSYNVKLCYILGELRSPKYKDKIDNVRRLYSENINRYNEQKKSLPAITFCGTFSGGHSIQNLTHYNNLIVLDIDKLNGDGLSLVRNSLQNDKYVFSHWLSPSGCGYKALVFLQYENDDDGVDLVTRHKLAFKMLCAHFSRYGIVLDSSGADVPRLCFVSYDPNLSIRSEALPFCVDLNYDIRSEKPLEKHPSIKREPDQQWRYSPSDRIILNQILRYLRKHNKSITSTYDAWMRVGFAVSNTFRGRFELGQRYYLYLCEMDGPRYDKTASIAKYKECYDHNNGSISFGTIVALAKEQGYSTGGRSKGSR